MTRNHAIVRRRIRHRNGELVATVRDREARRIQIATGHERARAYHQEAPAAFGPHDSCIGELLLGADNVVNRVGFGERGAQGVAYRIALHGERTARTSQAVNHPAKRRKLSLLAFHRGLELGDRCDVALQSRLHALAVSREGRHTSAALLQKRDHSIYLGLQRVVTCSPWITGTRSRWLVARLRGCQARHRRERRIDLVYEPGGLRQLAHKCVSLLKLALCRLELRTERLQGIGGRPVGSGVTAACEKRGESRKDTDRE